MAPRMAIAAVALLAAGSVAAEQPTATLTVSQVSVSFLVSGQVGGGELSFQGKTHDFSVGGLGYGGIGASRLEATGDVYGLDRLEDFEGGYIQARAGAVAGDQQIGEDLWLVNPAGVRIHLRAKRKGYHLTLGGDAVYFMLD